jgi:hypothetical protein
VRPRCARAARGKICRTSSKPSTHHGRRAAGDDAPTVKRALIADRATRDLYACAECARNLENADLLLHAAMQLRDHVLVVMRSEHGLRHLYGIGLPGPRRSGPVETMGFKAFNLARMAAIGLPVPQAFVLGTLCQAFGDDPAAFRPALRKLLESQIERLEAACGLEFGSGRKPCWCRYARARRCPCPA